MPHLLEQQRSLCPLLSPLSIFFFCFCEERKDGEENSGIDYTESKLEWEELLIITLYLLQTYTRQFAYREQSCSGKAGTVATQTLQIQTQLHMPSLPETGAHSRISCPEASFLQMFPSDAAMREKQTAELSPAMASLHVLKSSIWKCPIHIWSGGTSPSKHI